MKRALITGITGQDGSYLAEILLDRNYEVHGMIRKSDSFNTKRIDHLYNNPELLNKKFFLHYGDLVDTSSLNRLLEKIEPNEIYNLGAQSHVKVSFEVPDYTAQVDALGTLRFLDSLRETGLKNTKFYQASTSELYGKAQQVPQDENTPFYPRSPYGAAKLYAYWIVVNYREAYDIFASNGILFNHESPRRGETFVTRKIIQAAIRIVLGLQDQLVLGNLNAKRDWGYAPEYCEGMWKILQYKKPDDFVLSTGESHSIRDFVELSFGELGVVLEWKGSGINEVGIVNSVDSNMLEQKISTAISDLADDSAIDNKAYAFERMRPSLNSGDSIISINPRYFRPTEVELLIGDSSKARRMLNWEAITRIKNLVKIMAESDMKIILISEKHSIQSSLNAGYGNNSLV